MSNRRSFLSSPPLSSLLALVLLPPGLLVLGAGCGDEAGRLPATIIRVVSRDIDEPAVQSLRLRLIPPMERSFVEDQELLGSGFIEGLTSVISGRELRITADAGYVTENAFLVPQDTANFAVEIPVFTTRDQVTVTGVELLAEVINDATVIGSSDEADSEPRLNFPLDPDDPNQMQIVPIIVACLEEPGGSDPLAACNP